MLCGRSLSLLAAGVLAFTYGALQADGQTQQSNEKSADSRRAEAVRTFTIHHLTAPSDLSDLANDLRNMLPGMRIYGSSPSAVISVRGTAEEIEQAQRLITDMDRPRDAYRLTYTITEKDGGRSGQQQHVSLIVLDGNRTDLKQGDRIPIVTGTTEKEAQGSNSQVQYLDVGMSVEVSLENARLRTKIEQTAVSEEKSGVGAQDPIVRQTKWEGASPLVEGKPVLLGSLDVPGTTRHREIEVLAERIQ